MCDELVSDLNFIHLAHAKKPLTHSQFVQIEINHNKAGLQNSSIKNNVQRKCLHNLRVPILLLW